MRETHEECAIAPQDVEVLDARVTAGPYPAAGDLPGEWTYTTVLARTCTGDPLPTTANEESYELRWVSFDEVESLPLLAAFRRAFPALRERVEVLNR